MRYLPKLPDDSYAKTETLKILKQHKAYMAQFVVVKLFCNTFG